MSVKTINRSSVENTSPGSDVINVFNSKSTIKRTTKVEKRHSVITPIADDKNPNQRAS